MQNNPPYQLGEKGSSRFCVISLTYIGSIDLCVLCVFVVRSCERTGKVPKLEHTANASGRDDFQFNVPENAPLRPIKKEKSIFINQDTRHGG